MVVASPPVPVVVVAGSVVGAVVVVGQVLARAVFVVVPSPGVVVVALLVGPLVLVVGCNLKPFGLAVWMIGCISHMSAAIEQRRHQVERLRHRCPLAARSVAQSGHIGHFVNPFWSIQSRRCQSRLDHQKYHLDIGKYHYEHKMMFQDQHLNIHFTIQAYTCTRTSEKKHVLKIFFRKTPNLGPKYQIKLKALIV